MKLTLHVAPPDGRPFEQELVGESMVVGRASDCDVAIPDPYLSRHHARFERPQGASGWTVEDLGSRNGTHVNGAEIDAPRAIGPGDEIRLSASVIAIRGPAQGAVPLSDGSGAGSQTLFRPATDIIESSVSIDADGDTNGDAGELRRYAARLRLLNDVHQALSRPIQLDELLDHVLGAAFEHFAPEEGVIYLRDPDGGFRRAAERTPEDGPSGSLDSATLVREVCENGQAALIVDAETLEAEAQERFGDAVSLLSTGVRSLVAAPLLDAEGSLGMIALSSRLHKRWFSEDDMELLASLASAAAMRLRNLTLAEEAAKRRRLEQELDLARQIQIALLPRGLPEIQGYEVYGKNVPSRGVSGDIFEVVERDEDGSFIVLVADVSGKGMAASLLTASFEALAADPIRQGQAPHEILERVGGLLHDRTLPSKYVTAFVVQLEPESGRIVWSNGGHNPALLVRAGGSVERLEATGVPVGLLPGSKYETDETRLEAGDLLALYTDGFTEAESPDGTEYGIERLQAALVELSAMSTSSPDLESIAGELEKSLAEFVGAAPSGDDRTLVLLRRSRPE